MVSYFYMLSHFIHIQWKTCFLYVFPSSQVVLGGSDLRVPPSAGLRWAQAVEAGGGTVKVLWFEDQGHSIGGAEAYETAEVTILAWMLDRVK